MAVGTGGSDGDGSGTDSPLLVVSSAVAIAIVFVLIMLLIIFRARHVAIRRRHEAAMRHSLELQLALRQTKPQLYEVWLPDTTMEHTMEKGHIQDTISVPKWDNIMPFVLAQGLLQDPSKLDNGTYVGVVVQLPQAHRTSSPAGNHNEDGMSSEGAGSSSPTSTELVLGLCNSSIACRPP